MLDSLVDYERDTISGDFSFVSHYPDRPAAQRGLIAATSRSLTATRPLRHRHRHTMIVCGVAGYYAASAIPGSLASEIAPRLLAELSPNGHARSSSRSAYSMGSVLRGKTEQLAGGASVDRRRTQAGVVKQVVVAGDDRVARCWLAASATRKSSSGRGPRSAASPGRAARARAARRIEQLIGLGGGHSRAEVGLGESRVGTPRRSADRRSARTPPAVPHRVADQVGSSVRQRRPRAERSCRGRAGSTSLRAHFAHGANGEVGGLVLAQGVATLDLAQGLEASRDPHAHSTTAQTDEHSGVAISRPNEASRYIDGPLFGSG